MNKKKLILALLSILYLFTACSKNSILVKTQANPTQSSESERIKLNLDLNKEIKTKEYSVSFPDKWKVTRENSLQGIPTEYLTVEMNNTKIASVSSEVYIVDSLDPVRDILPNHSEQIFRKDLKGFFTDVTEFKLALGHGASNADQTITTWIYMHFVCKDR